MTPKRVLSDDFVSTKSIFLADDDEDDRMLFEDALREVAATVVLTTACDGEELLIVLKKNVPPPPEVIFLDLNMPRKNGFECLEEIKRSEKLKAIPIIVFSTTTQPEAIERAYQHGANYYICKPNSFSLLKKAIQHVLTINWHNQARTSFDNFLLDPSKASC